MTQDEIQALLVERYQPRHLTPSGEPMPAVQSFDELLAALRAEARQPVPGQREGYARTPQEVSSWQNEDADRVIQFRIERQRDLELIAKRNKAKAKARKPSSGVLRVHTELAGGKSLREALQFIGKG